MEDAANRIVGHYERHALAWDADRHAAGWIDKPCIERFLSLFHGTQQFLILAVGVARPLRFTWLPMVFASPAWTALRPSFRYAKPGCRVRSGS